MNSFLNSTVVETIIFAILRFLLGLLLVWLLFKMVNLVSRKIDSKLSEKSKIDPTIASFLSPIVRKSVKIFIVISFVSFIGIETTSIAAAITSVGLAIGLALQGALSNFAGGIVILLMRPYKIGDYISSCQKSGTVESIQLFYTTLVSIDNVVIKIPNGEILNNTIENMSEKKIRRLDLVFSISYDSDISLAKNIIRESIINSHMSLEEKGIFINVSGTSDNSIEIISRAWVATAKYWDLYYFLLEDVRIGFINNSIGFPGAKIYVKIAECTKSV